MFSEQIGLIDRVLAASTDHIYISDRNLRYVYASPAGLVALGLEQAQLLGKTWQELGFPAEIMEVYDLQRQSVLQTGSPIRGETSFPTINGVRYYEYVISPIEGNDGEIEAVITTTRDITERQQAEAALRQLSEELEARITARTQELAAVNESLHREIAERQKAEQASQESQMRFSALVDAMFEGIVIQEQGKIIEANSGFARMFGYTLEEVIGKSAVDFLTPESVQTVLRYTHNQYQLPYEITGIKKDGTFIQLEVVGKQSWYQGQSVRISAARDITERKKAEAERNQLLQQLEAERSRLEQVLQQMPVGVAIAEAPSGKLLFHNQEAIRVLQHPLLPAQTYQEYIKYGAIHEDGQPYQPQEYPIARSLLSGEVIKAEEMQYCRGDGTFTLLSVSAAPIMDRDGQIIATVSAFEDISERKQAEQRLAKESLRIQTLFKTSFDGIVILDQEGKVLDANPRFAQMLGYTPPEIAQLSIFDWDAQYTHAELQQIMQDCINSNSGILETQHRRKDGSIYDVEISFNVVEWEGDILRFCVCRDITERKRTEAALRENQIQLQRQLAEIETIYQSAPIGLSVLDPDLRFVRINERLAQMNGFPIDAHIGRTVQELLPNIADAAGQMLRSIFATGKPVLNIEITGETPAQPGVQRTWLESFLPLKDGERTIGINIVCEEITERKRAQQSLQESEATLRLFAQYAPAGIAMLDKDMRYIIASQRWVDEYHLDAIESLIGRSHYEIFPEIPEKWRQIHQRCLAGASEQRDEDLFIRVDGTQQWISWEIHPWHTATGEIGGIIIFGNDVTPQKQAKEALRKSEYLYRTLAHNFPNGGVNIFDRDLRYLLSDGTEIAKVGMTKEQLEGHTLWETVPPEISTVLEPPYRAALAGETTIFELCFGDRIYQIYTLPLFNEQGEIFAGLSMSQNITLQKQAEQTLRTAKDELELQVQQRTQELRETNEILQKREREFRTLVENTPDVISRHDRQYRYVYVNPAITQQSGIPIETYLGKTPADLGYPQEMTDFWTASLESVFTTGQMRIAEFRATQQDEWKAYQTYVVPELAANGKVESVLTITRDVTGLRAAEESSRKLAEELQRSNQELEQFAYVASHDLQEPLRAVTSFTQMLAKRYQGQLDAKADMYIEFIVDGAIRMQQLVRDLLAYSRAGRYELKLQSVDYNALLEQVKKDLQISITETQALITAEPLPTVLADPSQMSNLLLNLISNSLKYRSELPPKVYISAQKNTLTLTDPHFPENCNPLCATFQEEWIFMVQDNGIGIEPQYAERIFGIFQRLHASDEYSGTGLGLAICKKIVERHGGRIWVDSQLGQGATFYFTLPIGN
ncbi:PAS domain S-box protein [Tolypothrix sp. PCC 7910]|uniref:PAS domain-containing sensor histidine kinase n=1 Tax=Tolypothrix sp. PCC 7910 TaxID=2099387 RepID=UPI001427731D|nr:PAS domain S-box protein [Tolypothrix sp. PCC 7910]QIR35292.1 PAS domain S-box protein [Tolypothrix sp. PCC 7910]